MGDAFKPRDESDVVEAIAWAASGGKTLDVIGHGTKSGIGRHVQADAVLDVSALSGIVIYEPEELIVSAKAGTPVAQIEKMLLEHRQEFAFEPMDTGPLFGREPGKGTLGGMLSVNLSGPRRVKMGAARDFALGMRAISGRAETFKAGGRVVKNVTGYDLPKLMAGSFGTLAVMSELTFKVLPRAEDVETVLVLGLSDAAAVDVMTTAMRSVCDVSGAAHAPLEVAAALPLKTNSAVTALRLEGVSRSIAYRRMKLEKMFKSLGTLVTLREVESKRFWHAVRDVEPFSKNLERALWRISVVPSEGAKIGEAICAATSSRVLYDWSGGLIWVEMPDDRPQAKIVRNAVRGRGHAFLMRATSSARDSGAFGELETGLSKVIRGLKNSFDPKSILNPGRMYEGL